MASPLCFDALSVCARATGVRIAGLEWVWVVSDVDVHKLYIPPCLPYSPISTLCPVPGVPWTGTSMHSTVHHMHIRYCCYGAHHMTGM